MENDSKLSVNNMVELAMGLSMASLFANAMNDTYRNTARLVHNDQLAAPPKYIHAIVGGQQKGPYSLGEISVMVQAGDITPDTFMWKPGMPEWKKANEITDISPTFDIQPPRLPNE
ncbi:MAG: DUF4339 domain-containing protein [Tannerella sp.]|jgi:hypothetical protein|nr:DUF4339 domain-containing protein [Tannerella sp.]